MEAERGSRGQAVKWAAEQADIQPDDGGRELERVKCVYGDYRDDPRKRRAWSADNTGNLCMREEVLRALREMAPQAFEGERLLLDAGCGTGWWLARLCQEGVPSGRLVGVDLLAERVSAAIERAPGARVLQGDVRRLALPNASCSLAMLFTVLSALGSPDDVRAALQEARRVVGDGGAIAVWEPRVPSPNRHTRLISISEMRAWLGRDLEIRSVTLAPPLARRVGPSLYARLARVAALRTHRLVIARL